MKKFFLAFVLVSISCESLAQNVSGYLTNDGSWCWFSDPRAIVVNEYVISGWVKADGTIEAVRFDTCAQNIETSELYYKLEIDDHDNPAFVLTANGRIVSMYTRHSRKDLFINILKNYAADFKFAQPQLIHPISDEELIKFPRETMTYANPIQLKRENNRLYCFGRWTGFKPNMMWSDDGGNRWTKSKVFITNYPFDVNNRPYVKYFSDGESKIHFVFTDGHPRDEPTNSVYYAFYNNGAFYKASDKLICNAEDIPFEPEEASVVFTSNPDEGRAWIADIAQDNAGNPVILYTKSPKETNHEYWYARFTGNAWINKKICDSGKWFPQTPDGQKQWEAHYFGGMTLHPAKCNVVYLSRQINNTFEIERWETNDLGETWTAETVTENSDYDNVRPFIPRDLKERNSEIVLWMENQKYIHYTNFKSSIRYFIRKID